MIIVRDASQRSLLFPKPLAGPITGEGHKANLMLRDCVAFALVLPHQPDGFTSVTVQL